MDAYLHTMIATGSLAAAYYLGKYFEKHIFGKNIVENILECILESLEKDGFIATEVDKDGDKELIPVSEMVAKALREAKETP